MAVRDTELFRIIERLGEHYSANINNQYLRKAFTNLTIDRVGWERIDRLTTIGDYDRAQGFSFMELYERILAMARFIGKSRQEVQPSLRRLLDSHGSGSRSFDPERLRIEMAISNFGSNLSVLSDLLNELYMKVVELDKQSHNSKAPVYTRIPELKNIGRMLVDG